MRGSMGNQYSCGPCKKRDGWNVNVLKNALVGRSYRAKDCKERINEVLQLQRELLKLPSDYKIAIILGSDTAAVESALWNLLGCNKIDVVVHDAFSQKWYNDIANNLKLECNKFNSSEGVNSDNDIVFTYNGTTSGKCIGNLNFIEGDRKGIVICDATSAAFAYDIDWTKIDVFTYSWQKTLGGEAGHGVIVVSPRVFERLEKYRPDRPIPLFMDLRNEALFKGDSINTLSMLCIEDVKDALLYMRTIDPIKKTEENAKFVYDFLDKSEILQAVIQDKNIRSKTSITFTTERTEVVEDVYRVMAEKKLALDIKNYKNEPIGFRIWTGPTIDIKDLKNMMVELEKTIRTL
ncbi:MAG: aminotransferase class V-fold PLP-dependent enzyme [Rickettsiales bacterium]|jgi:phosphoserine aminotransferase|nr:aminotransferase class V-fold PLP-dependent enzyme [Rickettsiales bacterium]